MRPSGDVIFTVVGAWGPAAAADARGAGAATPTASHAAATKPERQAVSHHATSLHANALARVAPFQRRQRAARRRQFGIDRERRAALGRPPGHRRRRETTGNRGCSSAYAARGSSCDGPLVLSPRSPRWPRRPAPCPTCCGPTPSPVRSRPPATHRRRRAQGIPSRARCARALRRPPRRHGRSVTRGRSGRMPCRESPARGSDRRRPDAPPASGRSPACSSAADNAESLLSTVGSRFDTRRRSFLGRWPDRWIRRPPWRFRHRQRLTDFDGRLSRLDERIRAGGLARAPRNHCDHRPHQQPEAPTPTSHDRPRSALVLAGFAIEPRFAAHHVEDDEHGEHDEPGSSGGIQDCPPSFVQLLKQVPVK